MSKKILVIGATGIMGQRIVKLVERLLPDVEILKACRKTPNPSFYQLDIFDKKSLELSLKGVNVVINTVGPFYYDPSLLLTTCFNLGCHYIDLAETREFIDKVHQITNTQANNTSSYVITGCSTIPGLIDVFIQDWSEDLKINKIAAFLSMGSSNQVSPTLIYSLLRPLGLISPANIKYFSQLVTKNFANIGKRVYGNYPSAFDLAGVKLAKRTLPLNFYAGFDKPLYSYLLFLAAKVLPLVPDNLLISLAKTANLLTPIVQSIGSPIGILLIEALGENNQVLAKVEVHAQQKGLDIPALPAVWAAEKLLNNNLIMPTKMVSLNNLFSSKEITNLLLKEGYQVYGTPTN